LSDDDNLEKKILVERSHRTDDEEFYLPCVLSWDTVEAFLGAGLGWLYYYNYERVHSGYGMAGRTPYACCVALGFSGSEYVGLMPVVLLDNIVLDWSRQGVPAVNDVLTHYKAMRQVCGTLSWKRIANFLQNFLCLLYLLVDLFSLDYRVYLSYGMCYTIAQIFESTQLLASASRRRET